MCVYFTMAENVALQILTCLNICKYNSLLMQLLKTADFGNLVTEKADG